MSNLKLTKEECIDIIEFIDFFYTDNLIATAELRKEKPKEVQEEDARNLKSKLSVLQQLIEEHFESSLTREKNLVSNLVSEIDKLEKALDKSCEHLSNTDRRITCGEYVETCMDNHCYGVNCVHARRLTKEEWKEYLFNETN